ncbi:MAG: metallophosphoesterase [bacterium]
MNRKIMSSWVHPLVNIGNVWLGIISIGLAVFLLADIMLIFFRQPLARYYGTIVAMVVLLLVSGYSLYNGTRQPIIKQISLKMNKLPPALSGFSLVQLSDIHLNSVRTVKWLDEVVEETNKLNPDVIVITGDLIDADMYKFNEFVASLRRLKSKYGVFAITGNHEYYAGLDLFLRLAGDTGITVLRNAKTSIAGGIELVGIDDITGKMYSGGGPDLKKAMENIDRQKPVILLSHNPATFKKDLESGIDLQLSGHTHAGQIPPMDLIVMFYYKYPYGLHKKNDSYIYTTSGTGTWGPPMRFSSRSEIMKIVLVN